METESWHMINKIVQEKGILADLELRFGECRKSAQEGKAFSKPG